MLPPLGYSNQLTSWLSLTEAGIDRTMRSVSLEYPARLLLERWRKFRVNKQSVHWRSNVPEFGVTISLQVVYRAKKTELTTGDRAHALAETMVAILRDSPKVKAVEIQCESVGNIEPLENDDGRTQLRIKP